MLLLRGATRQVTIKILRKRFQYMLLLRGATDALQRLDGEFDVSIHAPLARSNLFVDIPDPATAVSIHAPLARSNGDDAIALEWTNVSIHAPLARSNASLHPRSPPAGCFNTCSSCEEQPGSSQSAGLFDMFQYMLLLRGATKAGRKARRKEGVSIHAPLARSNSLFFSMNCANVVSIHAPLARSNLKREKLIPAA